MFRRTALAPQLISASTFSLILICSIVGIYAVAGILVRPSMYSDSGWGFLVWDSMQRGAPFNHISSPDHTDISRDTVSYVTTWSPGQYWLPGFLESWGLSLGVAIELIVAVFSILGLAGWYVLYRAFGFPHRTVIITLLLVACTRIFALPFGIYNGGEVLLFGAAPWFAFLVFSLRGLRWRFALPIFAGIFPLVFAKLTGVIFAFTTISAASLSSGPPWLTRATVRKIAVAGSIIVVFALMFYFAWMSRGWTPATPGSEIHWLKFLTYTAFSVTSVWASALSLGDFLEYIFVHPGRKILTSIEMPYYALAPVAIASFVLVWRYLQREYADYKWFVLFTISAYMLVMILISVGGGAVGTTERHFRPASLLLLVGLVHMSINIPSQPVRIVFASFFGVLALYGPLSFAVHAHANLNRPLGDRGFRHPIATQAALDFIKTIDMSAPDGQRPILLVTSPEIGLEPRHARIIANHADFESAESLSRRVYRGRVNRIYVLVQTRLVANGKADIILRSFVDYPIEGWKKISLGEFTCFSQ